MTTTSASFIDIALDNIKASPTNPRKTFKGLDELAESITAHGVLQPITVRPHPKPNGVAYELAFGERRWRASKLAKLETIPAIVRELTDTEVLEGQLVENVQRADVHPLEEANGYQALIEHHGYTIDTLASKTGRSRAHLYGRLKLTKLAPGVKKAFLADEISASVAELLARIPVAKLQEQALVDVLGGKPNYTSEQQLAQVGIEAERVTDDGQRYGGTPQPLSFRAAQALVHRRYATRLELAVFPIADAILLPEAGPCTTCVHRSGNQPELFPDLAKPADVCTNPPCFEKKTGLMWKSAKAAAKERGIEVVEGADAKDIFGYDGKTSHRSPYVGPDDDLPYDLQKSPGNSSTWSKLLGKKHEVPTVLVQDPTGAPRELLVKAKAVEVLREAGKIDKAAKSSSSTSSKSADAAYKEQRKKDDAKRELKEAALVRACAAVGDAAADLAEKKELALWRWIATAVLQPLDGDPGCDLVANRRGCTKHAQLEALIEKARSVGDVRGLLVEVLFAQVGDNHIAGYGGTENKRLFEEMLKLAGIDWDKAMDAAKVMAKLEAQADDAKATKGGKSGKKK